jgi:hypothetical protein
MGTVAPTADISKKGAIISLRVQDYNPYDSLHSKSFSTRSIVTDENGLFKFENLPADTYTLQGFSPVNGHRLLHFDILIRQNDTIKLKTDTLQATGKLRLYLPNSIQSQGAYVYVPGTTIGDSINESAIKKGYLEIDSIPATRLPGIYYSVKGSLSQPVLLRSDITVTAGETVQINFPEWKYSKKLFLNTTSSGANVSGTVTNFPLMIRLDAVTFNFNTAKFNGEDLRFTKSDNTLLSYEIEQWDATLQKAIIWVKVDTIYGNDKSHYINMYWGNAVANDNSSSTLVFDTSAGFQGVWHLGTDGTAKDATGNHYDGTPSDTVPVVLSGAIGMCRAFNGLSNYLHIKNTADSKINFQEYDTFSISSWAYIDSLDNASHLLIGKGNEQYFMKFKTSTVNNPMVWEFVNYHNNQGWYITNTLPSVVQSKIWVAVTGVQKGPVQYLYVNGELVDSTISISPSSLPRTTESDLTIGRFLSIPNDSIEGLCPFNGKIDEVRISNIGYSTDWIKLCYMNQNVQDLLVNWQ